MSDATYIFRDLPLYMPLDCSLGSSLNMHMRFTRSCNWGCDELVEYCSLPTILVLKLKLKRIYQTFGKSSFGAVTNIPFGLTNIR